jgi:hypothetical protein
MEEKKKESPWSWAALLFFLLPVVVALARELMRALWQPGGFEVSYWLLVREAGLAMFGLVVRFASEFATPPMLCLVASLVSGVMGYRRREPLRVMSLAVGILASPVAGWWLWREGLGLRA